MNLTILRKLIDSLDYLLLFLLSKRRKVVKLVAIYKRTRNLPALDPVRWQQVISTRKYWGIKLGINSDFTQKFFNQIHDDSLQIEGEICQK